jgi:hypothetical protein
MSIYNDIKKGSFYRHQGFPLGLIIVLLGLVLLANNFHLLPDSLRSVIFTWPMLLISIGLLILFNRNGYLGIAIISLLRKGYFVGLIMIFIGFFFLLPRVLFFSIDFLRLLWPIILIVIGLILMFRVRMVRRLQYRHLRFKKDA